MVICILQIYGKFKSTLFYSNSYGCNFSFIFSYSTFINDRNFVNKCYYLVISVDYCSRQWLWCTICHSLLSYTMCFITIKQLNKYYCCLIIYISSYFIWNGMELKQRYRLKKYKVQGFSTRVLREVAWSSPRNCD